MSILLHIVSPVVQTCGVITDSNLTEIGYIFHNIDKI